MSKVLLRYFDRFEVPSPAEVANFDRYVGPDEEWLPALPRAEA